MIRNSYTKNILYPLLTFLVLASLAAPIVSYADAATPVVNCRPGTKGCSYIPLTTVPKVFTAGQATDPAKIITNIYTVSIGVAMVLAIIMIVWAGVEYSTQEAIQGKSDAKQKWEGALLGLLILLGSYILLRTINADLVTVNLQTPAANTQTSTP